MIGSTVLISSTEVDTWKLVDQNKTTEVFFYPIETGTTSVVIQGFEVSASFALSNAGGLNAPDITTSAEYSQMLTVMQSISFTN
jgi:hypothetical protein